MKISCKGFLLSLFWVVIISFASYVALMLLCENFASFLKPFVFLLTIGIFLVLFYLCTAHFKTFSAKIAEGEIHISNGFFIRRKTRLRLERVLSVKLLSTPLMRLLGIANILLVCEGSVYLLPLLKDKDCEELYSRIRKLRGQDEKL